MDDNRSTPVSELTDREIAEETLLHLRGFAKAIEAIGNNPMLKGFMPPMTIEPEMVELNSD